VAPREGNGSVAAPEPPQPQLGRQVLTGPEAITRLRGTVECLSRAVVPWRALLLVGVLSLLLGIALQRGLLAAHHPTSLPSGNRGVTAHRGLASLPAAARGPVSTALGADRRAYRVSGSHGVLLASDPAQRLHARFDRFGVQLRSGDLHAGLALRAIGYGRALAPVRGVAPRATANRVTYARPRLAESYANGPLGVEQGFTLARTPASRAGGSRRPLTLALALSGNGRAVLAAGGQAITLRHGSGSLRYDGLVASDASGRALHSWLELRAGMVLIRVDARHARYPLRIDPLVQQGEKLVGGDEEEGPGNLGTSVALSGDGSTALIGAPSDEDKGKGEMLVGAAWVFTRTGSIWTQQGPKLRGNERSGEGQFGVSVALSSDGNTALIGGIGDLNAKSEPVGAAWVFTRAGGTWTPQGSKLTGGSEETVNGRFGRSVALSADARQLGFLSRPRLNLPE
jgi:FG-GAP repeat